MPYCACKGDDNNKETEHIQLWFVPEVLYKRIYYEWHTDKKNKETARYDTIYGNKIRVLVHLLQGSIVMGKSLCEGSYIVNRYLELILEQNQRVGEMIT